MLTQARLEMIPGDKRLLKLALPEQATFWFAFVNGAGVWPWLETNVILIPLEQELRSDRAYTVELFYSSKIGKPGARALDLQLVGPKFDLPLEDITWRVFLNEKWELKRAEGTLQLSETAAVQRASALDVSSYLQGESARQQQQTKQAEQWLNLGNQLITSGDNRQARAALNNAFDLSRNDAAFNEDARVQLHNLKMQQALIGLNAAQAQLGIENGAVNKVRELQRGKGVQNYSQEDAKQIIEANLAEDNAAQMKVAERLVEQQDVAVARPTAIRATIPEQGRLLTFKRSVQVNEMADMHLSLAARAANTASFTGNVLILLASFVVGAVVVAMGRRFAAASDR
jgi:hypothetical protein